jgi:hypothetical protein
MPDRFDRARPFVADQLPGGKWLQETGSRTFRATVKDGSKPDVQPI